MSCSKLRFASFPLAVALVTCIFAYQSPAACALQTSKVGDPVQNEEEEETDLMRVKWFKLNPTGSRAKFEMPAKPRFVERTFTPVKGKPPIKVRLFIASTSSGKVNFTFNYNDMSEAPHGDANCEYLGGCGSRERK